MKRLLISTALFGTLVLTPGCAALDGSAEKINGIAAKIEQWTSGGAAHVVDGTLKALGLPAIGSAVNSVAAGVQGLTSGSVKYGESLKRLGEAVDTVKVNTEDPPASNDTLLALGGLAAAYAGNKLRQKWLKTPV